MCKSTKEVLKNLNFFLLGVINFHGTVLSINYHYEMFKFRKKIII